MNNDHLVYKAGADGEVLNFNGSGGVDVPKDKLALLGDEVTIAFWQYGIHNTSSQSIIFNSQKGDKPVIKIRFPMSDGTIIFFAGGDSLNVNPSFSHLEGRWNHWAFTKNAKTGSIRIYLNGVLISTADTAVKPMETPDAAKIGSLTDDQGGYKGKVMDFRLYNTALNADGILDVYNGGRASDPSPADESNLLEINGKIQPLSWASDPEAVSYDVYLGYSYDSIEKAGKSSSEYKGSLTKAEYVPEEAFEEGKTYYWRVDRVTASGTYKGMVWSFDYSKWNPDQYKQWGDETLELIERDFRIKGTNGYYEDNNRNQQSFAWPSSIMIMALAKAAKVSPDQYADRLKNYVFHINSYWAFSNGLWGYDCVPNPGTSNRFYDDNTWMAWGIIDSYHVTKSDFYLQRAKDTFKFILSGEDDTYGGGIWWKENWYPGDPPKMKGVSSTAGAAIAGAKLYEVTGDEQYRKDAVRILDWLENTLRDENGLIMNDITENGVGRSLWSYNTGVPLMAYAILYKATGDEEYLTKAKSLSRASEAYWIDKNQGTIDDEAYFAFTIVNGWLELYQATGDARWLGLADKAIKAMHENRDANGRYPKVWTTKPGAPLNEWNLLISAAAARIFWAAAEIENPNVDSGENTDPNGENSPGNSSEPGNPDSNNNTDDNTDENNQTGQDNAGKDAIKSKQMKIALVSLLAIILLTAAYFGIIKNRKFGNRR